MNDLQFNFNVDEVRHTFDSAFSAPPRSFMGRQDMLLLVGLWEDAYAVRMRELSGVHRVERITPLPGATPDLLGIAVIQGHLTPIFSVGVLLGYPQQDTDACWVLLASADPPVGLAIPELQGYHVMPGDAAPTSLAGSEERAFVSGYLHVADGVRTILNVAAIIQAIYARVGTTGARHKGE